MKRRFSYLLTGLIAAFSTHNALAEGLTGKDTLIGYDLSSSTQLVTDPAYAALVAKKTYAIVRGGQYGDRIRLRTFGSYDSGQNPLRIDKILSRRARPKILASALYRMIGRIPVLVQEGKIKAQQSTHIAAFLTDMAPSLRCTPDKPGAVILFTDGVESTRSTRLDQKSGRLKLPAPASGLYKHCAFYLYGAGQLGKASSPKRTQKIITAWKAWAGKAGFSKVHIVRVW